MLLEIPDEDENGNEEDLPDIPWGDIHVGIREWAYHRMGEPSIYTGNLREMPAEVYRVFRFCIDWHRDKLQTDLDDQVKRLVALQLARL